MKKVADNSFLQDEVSLSRFLRKSHKNVVVLSDYSAMEAYRSGNIAAVYKVTKVLAEHPGQVEVLKGSAEIAGLSGRGSGLRRRLVDKNETGYFQAFCREVEYAADGSAGLMNAFSSHVQSASEQLGILLRHAERMAYAYKEIEKTFTQDELKIIRTREVYTPSVALKLSRFIVELAAPIIQEFSKGRCVLRKEEVPNLLVFRLAACNTVLMLQWLSVGGAQSAAPEKLRNDMVDCHISAYGTYFDGILTKDHKQERVFNRLRYILRNGFGV